MATSLGLHRNGPLMKRIPAAYEQATGRKARDDFPDWNIAHQEIDLKNCRGNRKNSGFLPEERAWVSKLLDEGGWCDVYRQLYPTSAEEAYTWWSNRGQAWANNVGWRLDYQLATPKIAARAKSASVYKAQRFSDHAPLTIDYVFDLASA